MLAGLSVLTAAVAAAAALGPLAGMPHVTDEVAYTLQSRLFAAGMRVGPPADNASMLAYPFWVTEPISYAAFPPGWPALLALGEALGAPFLTNPLLAAALPWLARALAAEFARPPVPMLAAFAVAISPGVWVLAASRMAHTSVLVALFVAAVVVARGRDGPGAWTAAGIGVAYVVLARPFDAALVGGPLLAIGLARARGVSRVGLVLPAALAAALVFADNAALTGSPWRFPIDQWTDAWVAEAGRQGCDRLGFGPDRGCHPGAYGYTPARAAAAAWETAIRLDMLLLGVPGGVLLVAIGAWRVRRWEFGLLVLVVAGGYALYWSPGLAYGARFWHPLYLVLPLLLGAGAHALAGRLAAPLLAVFVVASAPPIWTELGRDYWCVGSDLRDALEAEGFAEGVVLLRAEGRREAAWPALGVEEFACDPMLESGDGMGMLDPTRPRGGLQVRHALDEASENRLWLDRFHPRAPAILSVHDVAADRRRLFVLR